MRADHQRFGFSQGSCAGGAQGGAGVRAAGKGFNAEQDAATWAAQMPFVHTKLAAPLVGPSLSVTSSELPEGDCGAWDAQVWVPTVQPSACAGHASCVVQLTLAAALQAPLLQLRVAVPVVGRDASLTVSEPPDVDEAATA